MTISREYSKFYIDGKWQDTDSRDKFTVVSPATGKTVGSVPAATFADIDRAVEAARRAFYETDWKSRPVEERAQTCERLASLIAEHRPEFRDLIIDELGATYFMADVYHSIAPTLHWNYYAAVGRKTRFAEVRESDMTPLAGGAESSRHLVEHRDVDMVSFTGSSAVGRAIAHACAEQIKLCVLELGGKSAAIVLDDADLEAALPALVGTSVGTASGQNCTCMSRILVPRNRYDEAAGMLTEAFRQLKVGDPQDTETVVGPVISRAHRDRILALVQEGVKEGAAIATGGKAPEHLTEGAYVEPTLLTGVSSEMTVAQEEFFGPVVVLIPYDDQDDAIRIANDSKYGLAGCVFTADPVRGFDVARRIRTGTFSVNTFAADFNSPFGGFKQSGIGREHGPGAIQEYLLDRTISVDPDAELPPQVIAGIERVAPPF